MQSWLKKVFNFHLQGQGLINSFWAFAIFFDETQTFGWLYLMISTCQTHVQNLIHVPQQPSDSVRSENCRQSERKGTLSPLAALTWTSRFFDYILFWGNMQLSDLELGKVSHLCCLLLFVFCICNNSCDFLVFLHFHSAIFHSFCLARPSEHPKRVEMLVKAPLKERSGCKPFIYSAIPGQDLICCQKAHYRERDKNVQEGNKNVRS